MCEIFCKTLFNIIGIVKASVANLFERDAIEMSFEDVWQKFLTWLLDMLPNVIGAALIFAGGWWLSNVVVRLIKRTMTRARTETGIVTFLCSLANAAAKIIISIMALSQLGVPVGPMITAIGAAGVTVGLALKENMTSIASGAQIVFTKPFAVGDYLLVDNVEGTVERIEMMFTTLRTFDNKEIVIPNSTITVSTIINYTAMKTRRLDLRYSVGYEDDLSKVKEVLQELTDKNPLVERDPEPLIAVEEHKDSCIQMLVRVWCKTDDYWTLYYQMQEDVKLAFDREGIHIPFPQLDVHLDRPVDKI